jgi:nicotinamidase/pyrazinamidase
MVRADRPRPPRVVDVKGDRRTLLGAMSESSGPSVDYGPRTALVVVDMQNDFAHPDGALYVRGGAGVVGTVNREVRRALAAGAVVVYTQDWHPASTPHFAKDGGIWPVHCVAGSWGAQFEPSVEVAGPVVRKGTRGEDGYSGFTVRHPETGQEQPTELGEMLRDAGTEQVVVVGLATDYCVKDTALDAVRSGFATTVLTEGARAVDLHDGDGARALGELARAGVTLTGPSRRSRRKNRTAQVQKPKA